MGPTIFIILVLTMALAYSVYVFANIAAVALVLYLAAIGVLVYWRWFEQPRRRYRKDDRFHSRYEMEFTDDAFRFESRDAKTEIAWSFFTRFAETKRFYLLVVQPTQVFAVPKRAFDSPHVEADFVATARARVSPR